MKIIKHISPYNHNKGRGGQSIKYIVVHYTGGKKTAAGAAYANAQYFYRANRGASAHYFIDDGEEVYQVVEDKDTAWAVGAKVYKGAARNQNSLSIEVCSAGAFTNQEINTLTKLVHQKMAEYRISPDRVIRHYDVTGKLCPAYYVDNEKWKALHARITGAYVTEPKQDSLTKDLSSLGLVDYLVATGRKSSFSARAELAASYGIQDYKGTAAQNTELLQHLRNELHTKPSGTWQKNDDGWWYERADGSWPADEWEQVGGTWFWFDKRGYCIQNAMKWIDGKLYAFSPSGACIMGQGEIVTDQTGAIQTIRQV